MTEEEEGPVAAAEDSAAAEPAAKKKPKTIEIEVNARPVEMEEKDTTGGEIKAAAIAQGVPIQETFVLQLEQANGTSRVIGDADPVKIHPKMSFTAIAPDDNS